ncbi:glycosyltransferase [Candidatus Kaiserbacteria bacterium]|nr:glycosyltransferase [Candidatus Kaiserbacteria bacterium]
MRYTRSPFDAEAVRACAVIPTYKPETITVRLVEGLVRWNPRLRVYVVDDCTPQDYAEGARIFERITRISSRVTLLRTPVNALKAGALNYGLEHVFEERWKPMPDVVLTLDDDVVIVPTTVRNLVTELMAHEDFGAVCSQCHVLNKNRNLLTRLQGLEYLGFNATRLADEGFFMGPLVMHGMLTAFRTSALQEIGGFIEGHLIEDYEITARLKTAGWSVKSAVNSDAWTVVPETLGKLWRQRTRWSYGGITVIDGVKRLPSVMQDLIGHGTFWAIIFTIDILIVSILFGGGGGVSPQIPYWIIGLSVFQLAIWYVFQLWLMRLYKEKDIYDWLIRLSLVPEFIYVNVLSLVLLGAYFFLFFNVLTNAASRRGTLAARRVVGFGSALFRFFGYTKSWGTRIS